MARSSLEMRLAVKDFHVATWSAAQEWQLLLEADGYFVSFMKERNGYRVYYWY